MIFLPYLVYLGCLYQLSGVILMDYIEVRVEYYASNESDVLLKAEHDSLRSQCMWMANISFAMMMFFGCQECKQLMTLGWDYFGDFWNVIDVISLVCNYNFLMMFYVNVVFDMEYFMTRNLLRLGSFAMFFMWVKVFYWLRLLHQF